MSDEIINLDAAFWKREYEHAERQALVHMSAYQQERNEKNYWLQMYADATGQDVPPGLLV